MRLFVCWDTRTRHPIFGDHPCGQAHEALINAGYEPEVVKARGWTVLPDAFNNSAGRREVRKLSGGNDEVPALVLDSGEFIQGSGEIIEWAAANPDASSASASS